MNTPREPGPHEPGIDQLISALTADGDLDELASRGAALAAFRAARERAATEQTLRQRRVVPFRRPPAGWLPSRPADWFPTRLAAITTAAVVVIAAIAAAAYTRVLPGPVQDAAHTVFAPLGVPGGHPTPSSSAPGQGPAAITDATRPGDCPSCAAVFKTPSPRSGNHYVVTLNGARGRVTDGVVVVLTGRVDQYGSPAAGVRVALVARTAASARWRIVASGVTGPRGGFRFVTPPLTASAVFRLVAPDGAYSGPVRVAVPRTPLSAGSLRLVPPPSHQDEPPRDDDEQEPRDPGGGAARGDGDHHPEHDRERGRRCPGDPGQVPGRHKPAVVRGYQPRTPRARSAAPGGTDPG